MTNKAQKSFQKHPMELLDDEAQVESYFGPFGDSVSISASRCTVCAQQGSKIILNAPDGTPR